ncbi:predicted protein [Plenodomus lingam JN3]|uniref:Predicted protein n=1 Tax=Leptosphaeria maculans (strain JN3 / isolate v23.1.3 / race Av1-4-5-6-7-8) TaxID=985895 RepID=E5A3E3_LEPMJ|nr:predicted protein [Plenodomus lingam JN3]CBX98156.1 predicted protein [Plenodomus lingam JN3]
MPRSKYETRALCTANTRAESRVKLKYRYRCTAAWADFNVFKSNENMIKRSINPPTRVPK